MIRRVIADSGAFRAFNAGVELDLNAYIRFIRANRELLHSYVSLDVIPGTNGESDAGARSYDHHRRMQDAGLEPIPVFHEGDDIGWLERMIEDGEPYIGLSPIKPQRLNVKIKLLDRCFDRLIANGRPLVKTHGFGVTDVLLLHRYPWTTVDSRTWSKQAEVGRVPVALRRDGRWDYSVTGDTVSMTDRSRGQGRHIDDLTRDELETLRDYIDELKSGLSLSEVRYCPQARRRVQVLHYRRAEASVRTLSSIFRHKAWARRPSDWIFEIAFGTSTSCDQDAVLTEAGVELRLLSWDGRNGPNLANYINSVGPKAKRKAPSRKLGYSDPPYIEQRKLALYNRLKEYERHDADILTSETLTGFAEFCKF